MLKSMPSAEIDALLGAVVETTAQGICLVNNRTRIAYANLSYCRMIGREPDEVIDRPISDFLTSASVEQFLVRQPERLMGRLRQQYEVQYIHGITGETIYTMVNVSPLVDPNGVFLYSIGVHTNITETRRIQEELARTVNRLKKAQQMAQIGFWEYDVAANEIWWSEEVHQIFQSPKPQSYEEYLRFVHPEDLDMAMTLRQGAEKIVTPYRSQYRIVRPSGDIRHVQHFVDVERNQEGKAAKLMGTIHDITDQVQRDCILEEQRAQIVASSKLSTLGEMAGGIAHEINTPLAVVLLNAESLLREIDLAFESESGAHKRVRKIIEVTQRIAKIVNGLKTFSRTVDHDPYLPTSLNTILEETLQLCQERFKNSGVEVTTTPFTEDIVIECRATQVSQILLNLFNNAFDAISGLPEKWIQVEVIQQPDTVDIAVTDSGLGVSPHLKAKIFNPFFTTKEVGKGMGLGLSTSKGLVESHHGKMWLDSESKRTRFVFRLPLRHKSMGANATEIS